MFAGSIGGPDQIGDTSIHNVWFDTDDVSRGTVNGNASTTWDSNVAVTVDEVRIRWAYGGMFGGGAAGGFAIDRGDSSSGPWTQVLADADPVTTAGASYPGDFEHTYTLGSAATARYWRFRSTDPFANNDIFTIEGIGIIPPGWTILAPRVIDDDDATYHTVTGTDLIRLDLGAAYRITSTRIRIASNTSGARTLTIKAANVVDFSDEVTIATITYTATGSYTAQDLTDSWTNGTAYRYWELSSGTSDTYRIHAWEMYEGTLASDFAAHLDDATDAHDGSAVSYDNTTSGLAATDVQAAIDEVAGSVGSIALDDLTDVTITSPAEGARLRYDGTAWVDSTLIWRPATTYDGTNWLVAVDGSGNAIMTEA